MRINATRGADRRAGAKRRPGATLLALLLSACVACASAAPEKNAYRLAYVARLIPDEDAAAITLTVHQPRSLLRTLNFNAPASRFSSFEADGELEVDADRVVWRPPARGGSIRYRVAVNSLRGKVYEARLTDRWGVFRLDDLFPPASTRAVVGSEGSATLRFSGPEGWSFETPYGPSNEPVHHIPSDRLFPRPTGWAVVGDIGVRRDLIAGRRVAVAAPVGEGFRRQDTLAFLRWTLPTLVRVFPDFPPRLLIVGGGQDMWRGGLSGPWSLYLHPDRPLISGNGTSAVLHELVHVAVASTKSGSDDWLVEGLAEYYSLEVLRRSGGISEARFEKALRELEAWSDKDGGRLTEPSTGADTAYATLELRRVAQRLSETGSSMDDVVAELVDNGTITGAALVAALERRGMPASAFADIARAAARSAAGS
ncbi:MAG: hypothetical protein PVH91_08745 [Pseudomonadales bacterium]|jgi:hypothetical protein